MTPRYPKPGTIWAAVALAVCLVPSYAEAQTAQDHRVHVSGGFLWFGSSSVAEKPAGEMAFGGLTRNVFQSETQRDASFGFVARASVRVTSMVQAESAFTHNHGGLSTRLTEDTEAATTTARESVARDLFEGGVVVGRFHGRADELTPFITAGAGYARLLHEGRTFTEGARTYYVGGGAQYLLRSDAGAGIRAAGLRFDARALLVRERLASPGGLRWSPVLGVSLFVGF